MTIIWYMVPYISTATERPFLSSWAIFCPPPNSPNENIKKMKKMTRDIISLDKYTINHDHRLYCSWDMVRDRCNCYFSFRAILPQMCGDLIILHMCTKNYDLIMYSSWDMVHDWHTDRWMDRRKKWHIDVGAPHNDAFLKDMVLDENTLSLDNATDLSG